MMLVKEPVDRAFIFKVESQRFARLRAGWTDAEVRRPAYIPETLLFEPVNFVQGIGPSSHNAISITPCSRRPHGGGSQAGYARWERFKTSGLSSYAAKRNTPHVDGVSRLALPALWYGVALSTGGGGSGMGGKAQRSGSTVLIWRELAHAWCAFQADVHSVDVLPEWALETLRAHQGDTRHATFTDDELHEARTGDRLWDACQRSLLKHGDAQQRPDDLGQADRPVGSIARGGAPSAGRAQQQVRIGWARPQLVRRSLLVPGSL